MNITMYTKPGCPFCMMAEKWLTRNGYEFNLIEITDSAELETIKQTAGMSTVPIIYADEQLVGGYTDLIESELFQ